MRVTLVTTLHREVDHGSTNLHSLVVSWQEGSSLFNQHKGTELRLVVLKHKFAIFELNLCMAARNGDVVDSEITFVTTSQFENILLWSGSDNMDDPRGVLFLVERLEHHVITGLLFVLYKFVLVCTFLNHEGVRLFADFALESLPEKRAVIW